MEPRKAGRGMHWWGLTLTGAYQGRTDNSWGPWVIGDHGAPVSLPKLKKAYKNRYQEHLMGPPTDPGPSGSARVSKWSVRP
ncbi:unnamed protein product, partial [Staurois parvus]